MSHTVRSCVNCGATPILAQRLDGAGWRAVVWCVKCSRVAWSSSSFAGLKAEFVALLPIVKDPEDKQGSLL